MPDDRDVNEFTKSYNAVATVGPCRSPDPNVFLRVDEKVRGWHNFRGDHRGFAICAAARAAGKSVYFRYSGYDPNGAAGTGYFESVAVALDPF